MADITVPKGDYGFYLNFTVQDADGNAFNLTDYTIKLKVWSLGAPGTLMVDGSCTIANATAGTCRYTVQDGDFDAVGDYEAELELTKAGQVESTRRFTVAVLESG